MDSSSSLAGELPVRRIVFVMDMGRIIHWKAAGGRLSHGMGESGMTGIASALTRAVYHATGVRVRQIPIRIEQFLQPKRNYA